jgi:hypothetical protein
METLALKFLSTFFSFFPYFFSFLFLFQFFLSFFFSLYLGVLQQRALLQRFRVTRPLAVGLEPANVLDAAETPVLQTLHR